MGGGVITPPYNGWYETYKHHFDDQLTKADNLNTNLSFPSEKKYLTNAHIWCLIGISYFKPTKRK